MNVLLKTIGFFLNVLAVIFPRRAGRLGFAILCRPVRTKITQRHRTFFDSADQFTLQHGNDTVRGYRWGNGPQTVLLLHGWQSHSYYWKQYVDTIDLSRYTLYAFDAPGHGLSTGNFLTMPYYSDVVEKVIEQIGSVNSVVAHSIGGLTAIYTFYRKPTLSPARLVTLSAPGQVQEFFDLFKRQLGLTQHCVRQVMTCFEALVQKPTAYYSAATFARSLISRGLVIHDQNDRNTPVANARAIHENWKQATLMVTNGNDHNLRSADVVKQVSDFLSNKITQPY
ncbi:alpha/beta fold hydrolase [Spirosoma montaniterrae]|uniref:AB hydrolase-1 domain-containing protein n=1 Tax=Spirosoma montaniterrae TaxID=1178516 RepID=A0A1P9WYM2_9BACT|nr:alpha/beta hydrolase [Spirosoma montaniterrae]AQG80480.1 hypothetical protein AWR27_14805 [Spirosoma montaniterrae]